MKIKIKEKSSGFTLVETLIYAVVFAVVVGAVSLFALNLSNIRLRSQMVLEINDQGSNLMRVITQTIRNSKAINSPVAGTASGVLSLLMASSTINPTNFSAGGEALYVTEGAAPAVVLTNSKVKVTNLSFYNASRLSTPGVVQIRYTLTNTASTTRSVEQYSVDFYGSAAIR